MKPKKVIIILFILSLLSIILFNFYCVNKKGIYFKKYFEFNNSGLRRFFYSSVTEWWRGKYTKDKIDRKISFSNRLNEEFRRMPFSIKWAGLFYAERSGQYKFYLKSDDGSLLYIDRKMVLDNGGIHPVIDKVSKKIFLNKGFHYICVYYFQHLGDAEVEFYWRPVGKDLSKTNNLGRNFHPVNSLFDIERDELEFDKILAIRSYGNYILLGIILLIAIGHLNITFFWIKNSKIIVKILTNWARFVKRIYPRWSSTLQILDGIINILIAIDLIAIFIINLTGGINLGISILGLKLKATEFYRPVNLLLVLVVLKIILIWKRATIWKGIENWLSGIANLSTNPKTYKYLSLITLGAIVIFGAKLRISHYTSKAMWWDEVLVLITVKNRSFIDVIKQLSYSLHEPLYYFFVKAMYFFSRSDAVVKLPSLVSGIAAIIILFYIAKNLCNRKIAFVSAYLLSVSAVHIEHSQMLRMYTMVTLFSLLSTYMFFQFLNSGGKTKKMWGYVVSSALALNTHVLSFTVFAAQIGYFVYCFVDDTIFKLWGNKKTFSKFIILMLHLLLFLVFDIKITNLLLFQLKNTPAIGTLSQKAIPLLAFLLLSVVTFILISILNILIHFFNGNKIQIRKPCINLTVFRKCLIAFLIIFILCPSFNKSLLHFILKHHNESTKPIFLREPLDCLIHDYEYNLTGQTGDWICGFRRDKFFGSFLFLLGITMAIFRKKRWGILFALHSISTFAFMFIIGYNKNSGSLVGERHLLLTLPPTILLVSTGLVWGAESIFNIFIYLAGLPVKGITKILSNLKNWSDNNKILLGRLLITGRNIFTVSLVLYVLINSWDTDSANIQGWYSQRYQDWFSYGKFLNENLRPGILFFFPNEGMQHHALAYTNRETEYLGFHPANSSQTKRTVWIAIHTADQSILEGLVNQGFKLIVDTFSYGRIYEKEFPVKSPILMSKAGSEDWIYFDGFEGHESSDKNRYKFISDFYKIKNISHNNSGLLTSVSNEPCSIMYKFISKDTLRSFILKASCAVGKASYIKIKFSLDGGNFEELLKIEESKSVSLDITKNIGDADLFYIEFELFAKRLPEDYIDALGNVRINDIQFQASL